MKQIQAKKVLDDKPALADLYIRAPMGLCYFDLELRYIHINNWLAEINGQAPQDHIGKTIGQVLPEAAAGVEPQLRQVIETGQPILRGTVAITFPDAPEVIRHFVHNYYPDINDAGLVIGVACSIEEVTKLRHAEESLRSAHENLERRVVERTHELDQANEKLRFLLESTSAVPWIADSESWNFTYVGPQAVNLLGYPIEEWYLPDFWVSHVHPDDRDSAIDSSLSSSVHHREYNFEYRMIRSDGSIVWIHDIVYVKREFGKPKTLHGFMIDITDSKHIEASLQKSEAHSRQLIESAPDGVIIMREDGTIDTINQRTEFLFGYDRDELVGHEFEILFPEKFRSGQIEQRKKYFKNSPFRPMGSIVELYGLRKDGSEFPIAISLGHVQRDTEQFAIATIRDITENKRTQDTLKNQREKLHRLTQKLMSVQENERRKVARELHDDITQRLAALAIETAILEQETHSKAPPLTEPLSQIAQQLRQLSSDVNDISRRLHPSILDHLGLAKAIESQCHKFQFRTGIPVTMNFQNIDKHLDMDLSLAVYRVLQESLRNIDKHAKADSVEVQLTVGDGQLVLTVSDSGVGFEADKPDGLGLGLVSMQERAEILGGTLELNTSPGEGVTVITRIPLKSDSAIG